MTAKKTLLVAALSCLLPAKGHTHHTSQVTRIGAPPATTSSSIHERKEPPRLSLGLALSFSYFGRARFGSEPYVKNALGKAWVETNTLDLTVALPKRFLVGVFVPAGVIQVRSPNRGNRTTTGLGDITLALEKQFQSPSSAPWLRVSFRSGLSLPTGEYRSESAFLFSEIAGGPNGEVGLRTYDSRAGLGADTFSLSGSVDVSARVHPNVVIRNTTAIRVPLGQTRDEIRWGSDISSAISLGGSLTETVALVGGAGFRMHLPDETRMVEGPGTHVRTGGRQDVAIELGLSVSITRALSCAAQARYPVWRHVSGVQLVDSFGLETNCRFNVQ